MEDGEMFLTAILWNSGQLGSETQGPARDVPLSNGLLVGMVTGQPPLEGALMQHILGPPSGSLWGIHNTMRTARAGDDDRPARRRLEVTPGFVRVRFPRASRWCQGPAGVGDAERSARAPLPGRRDTARQPRGVGDSGCRGPGRAVARAVGQGSTFRIGKLSRFWYLATRRLPYNEPRREINQGAHPSRSRMDCRFPYPHWMGPSPVRVPRHRWQ